MAIYTLYFYDAQDFSGGLPIEQNAKAAGASPHEVTLNDGASGIRITILDDDSNFDELDGAQQVLAEAVTVGGVTYPAGTTVNTAYDLQNSGTGMRLTSLHFGTDGYYQGPVHGAVTTEPLVPGQTYSFDVNKTSNGSKNAYEGSYVPCLLAGTRLDTPEGPRSIETLSVGDLVTTWDHGDQPIRHIWHHHWPGRGKAAPICIPAGVFGKHGAVLVSREHRVMLSPQQAADLCGWEGEALIAGKFLEGRWGVTAQPMARVDYWHLLLDRHEIVVAEGLPVETYRWTVKASEPFGAPRLCDLVDRFEPGRLLSSWPLVRPEIRRRHLLQWRRALSA